MKIAVWHNLPSGGGKRALYGHIKGLVERGHTVESWCPQTADQTYLPLSEWITEHIIPFKVKTKNRMETLHRKLVGGLDITDSIEGMEEHSRLCAEQIQQGGFDVLFANSCHLFASPYIGRYLDMPKVLYLQEPGRYLYEAIPTLRWIAKPRRPIKRSFQAARALYKDLREVQALRIQAREELTNAQAFDAILVNSYFSRESILRAYGIDAQVCYLGVDAQVFHGIEEARQDLVVGIGALEVRKDIGFVIDAVAMTARPHPRLVWIGNSRTPEYLEKLKSHAQNVGVEFEPLVRISDQEMNDVLSRARMLAYAPYLEPFGFAPLEANACGLPVVAVAEGGVRETVQNGVNGLLVAHEPEAMAAGIDRLRYDPILAHQLGENGRRLVSEQWSMASSIDRLEHRLKQAIASRALASGIS